jgi:hypothetical protein
MMKFGCVALQYIALRRQSCLVLYLPYSVPTVEYATGVHRSTKAPTGYGNLGVHATRLKAQIIWEAEAGLLIIATFRRWSWSRQFWRPFSGNGYVSGDASLGIELFDANSTSRTRGIRRKALQKIAALSATSSTKSGGNIGLERLYKLSPPHENYNGAANGHDRGESLSLGGVAMVGSKCPSLPTVQ